MIINVHAGHNPDGKKACGAVGIVKESTEARAINAKVIEKLRAAGHTVYDCTVNDGTGQKDVLNKIVAKCNKHTVDLNVAIHLNSGRNDYVGDGSTGGTEVFCYGLDSKAVPYAQEVAREISAFGFKLRDDAIKDDIKTSSTLYVLKNTKAPAMLIESFFVDDKDDVELYQKVGGADGIAEAIVKGILKEAEANAVATQTNTPKPSPVVEKVVMGVITGNAPNIRKGPGTNYGIVGNTKKGETVRVWKEENGWTMIDNEKWVSSRFVKIENGSSSTTSTPEPTHEAQPAKEVLGTIVGNGVNIRKGPGTEFEKVGKTKNGERVRLWAESAGWYMIDNDKWVSAKYVRK